MNAVYLFGCACGANGRNSATVQRKLGAKVYNTKRDPEKLEEHKRYLIDAGMRLVGYPAIVVENGGERITLLDQWTTQL